MRQDRTKENRGKRKREQPIAELGGGRKSTNSFSRDLPNPGIKPGSPALQADFLRLSHHGSPNLV